MTHFTAPRLSALTLAMVAGLAFAAPGFARAADLLDNTNNASATGSPFAYAMTVTHAAEAGLPLRVGNSAGASSLDRPAAVATSQAHGAPAAVVGNAASAFGGPGTGPVRG